MSMNIIPLHSMGLNAFCEYLHGNNNAPWLNHEYFSITFSTALSLSLG